MTSNGLIGAACSKSMEGPLEVGPIETDVVQDVIHVKCRAKLNLGLEVLGKRPDGFHDIRTIFQSIDLHDSIRFRTCRRTRIRCDDPTVPADSRNICWKAVEEIAAATGKSVSIDIEIRKRIPIGGGLGGGSSNAAATLWAANRLFGLKLGRKRLRDLGARVGADVPFFLHGGTVLGEGIGDRLTVLPPLEDISFLLVFPGFEVDTAWAYRRSRIELTAPKGEVNIQEINKIVRFSRTRGVRIRNDFLDIVGERFPILLEIEDALIRGGASAVSMSGSGSTMYGVFSSRREARRISRLLDIEGIGVCLAKPVRRGLVASPVQ